MNKEDHPRLCGEKSGKHLHRQAMSGSPPPMRGKVPAVGTCKTPVGITPAYAGKSHSVPAFSKVLRDHPRLCGEKGDLKLSNGCINGSPPPMRGKVIISTSNSFRHRITPAYAGKSFFADFRSNLSWDHPRLCGEKFASYGTSIAPTGSPPPMRGKVFFQPLAKSLGGITPAYAGKSQIRLGLTS